MPQTIGSLLGVRSNRLNDFAPNAISPPNQIDRTSLFIYRHNYFASLARSNDVQGLSSSNRPICTLNSSAFSVERNDAEVLKPLNSILSKKKKRKLYNSLGRWQKRNVREKITRTLNEKLNDLRSFIMAYGLDFGTIPIFNRESSLTASEPIPIAKIKIKLFDGTQRDAEESNSLAKLARLRRIAVAKDVNFISRNSFARFKRSAEQNDFPCGPKAKKLCKEAIDSAGFEKLQRNNHGYFITAEKKIHRVIQENFHKLKIVNNTIR
jgi:hypothetical protein